LAYIYILALFFFTITAGQVTSWTGNGGSGNNTVSNANNWSNGVPTATSIVFINETTCNDCTIVWDVPLAVAELHISATTGSGPIVQITGVNVTVTTNLTIGAPSATSTYSTYIDIQGGGIFEIGANCVATFYYQYENPITTSVTNEANWFNNKGTIKVLDNGGSTAGSVIQIGVDTDYWLYINSWGTWDLSASHTYLQFDYIAGFNIYGGDFIGGWIISSGGSTYAAIQWTGTDIVFQAGAGGDSTGAGAVTFEGAFLIQSYYTQSFSDYSTEHINSVTFNTTGVTISNAELNGANIVFLYDGWLSNCNITNYALVNSSTTVSGVHAYFVGINKVDNAVFAGVGTDFIVQVEYEATVTMVDEFALTGSVTLINNGTWVYDSNGDLYFDVQATWINLGYFQDIQYYNDYIKGTTFPGLSASTDVGTIINMGTLEFTNGGGLNFEEGTGTVRQCPNGVIKLGFTTSSAPGSITLPNSANLYLDGYVGYSVSSDYTISSSGIELYSWIPADPTATADVHLSLTGSGYDSTLLEVCFANSGTATLYKRTDQPTCPAGSTQFPGALPSPACDNLPDAIKNLQALASCRFGAPNCGIDVGAPAPTPAPASANVNAASLAFFVSLVCLLLKF